METLETLRKKITGAVEIQSVVRTMKTMAAVSIGQYETAVHSLQDYYYTVLLGLSVCFREERIGRVMAENKAESKRGLPAAAIVFGSDMGMVGQFNDTLADFVRKVLGDLPGVKIAWPVGDRLGQLLLQSGFPTPVSYDIPGSADAIGGLVAKLLVNVQKSREEGEIQAIYVFHNKPVAPSGYEPSFQQLLPLDEHWRQGLRLPNWPGKCLPEVAGDRKETLEALISEFLFVTLFKACAESLAAENASRLQAMERAKKNIDEVLEDLNRTYHRLRQDTIDEELFDVVAGFEALKQEPTKIQNNGSDS